MARTQVCRHRTKTLLGVDGLAYFYTCETCGAVLVRQAGRGWRVKPPAAS